MAKVKYYAKENSSIGTHSFYAVPIPNGTLTKESGVVHTADCLIKLSINSDLFG